TYFNTPYAFRGLMDQTAIYSRALSQSEIQAAMAGGTYTQSSGTLAVNGTLAAPTTNIQSGSATLGGTASIANAISLWKGEGNANDSVGSNAGSFQNGATTTSAGKIGSAFSLDGVDDYISIPDAPSLRPSSLTLAA